jgi:RNA 2',3'-cyclic 3'-phosphodiesterase
MRSEREELHNCKTAKFFLIMKRLFLAIDIHPVTTLTDAYENIRHTLRMEKINWVRMDQMHLTLAFLGDTEATSIPGLVDWLAAALNTRHSFRVTLSGLGVFRNIHDPRVLWIGCEAEKEFQHIKMETDNILRSLDFEVEDRPFSPHLTLGRIKSMRHLNHLGQLIGVYRDTVFQSENIENIVLYESRLTPGGPEYTPVHKFFLDKP